MQTPSPLIKAMRDHGTRARYLRGCKCIKCRAANSAYARLQQSRHGTDSLVSPIPAREHLHRLRKSGVGYRAVATTADLGYATLSKILMSRKSIRTSTERKVLAVTEDALSDGAFVSSIATRIWIAELLEEGFTKRRLARELGGRRNLQIGNGAHVRAVNQMKVEKLYRRYMAA